MPPNKPVRSLTDLSIKQLADQIVGVCKTSTAEREDPVMTRGHTNSLSNIKSTLEYLPSVLTDALVDKLINSLIDKRDRTLTPLFTAFGCLPLNHISKLDFRRAFMGYRLSRDLNIAFKSFCAQILANTDRLTELVLIAKCTDVILSCLAAHCKQLVHLNVALSDGITDEGIKVLCPSTCTGIDSNTNKQTKSNKGCPNLKILNLKDCYISPSVIAELVTRLPRLRRVYYTNMAVVVQELSKIQKLKSPDSKDKLDSNVKYSLTERETFLLDYFEFYSSENENFDLSTVQVTLPELTALKLLIKDYHMNSLAEFKGNHLQQIDLELSSDTGPGCENFFRSSFASNLTNISLQLTSFPADCVLAIAKNCTMLNTFKFTASTLEQEGKLVPSMNYFQNLQYLVCRVYSEEMDTSDEEEELGNNQCGIRAQTLEFLVQHSTKLIELQVQAHCSSYLTVSYLAQLIRDNPLAVCEKLVLDSPISELGRPAMDLLVNSLPSLRVLMVSRWKNIDHKWIQEYRDQIKKNNLDLELI